jgi:hypothetical protein
MIGFVAKKLAKKAAKKGAKKSLSYAQKAALKKAVAASAKKRAKGLSKKVTKKLGTKAAVKSTKKAAVKSTTKKASKNVNKANISAPKKPGKGKKVATVAAAFTYGVAKGTVKHRIRRANRATEEKGETKPKDVKPSVDRRKWGG